MAFLKFFSKISRVMVDYYYTKNYIIHMLLLRDRPEPSPTILELDVLPTDSWSTIALMFINAINNKFHFNYQLVRPRRWGKTSLCNYLIQHCEEKPVVVTSNVNRVPDYSDPWRVFTLGSARHSAIGEHVSCILLDDLNHNDYCEFMKDHPNVNKYSYLWIRTPTC